MTRNWGVVKAIRRSPKSPNPAIILGIPIACSAEINLAVEASRLKKGVLDIQALERPLLQGPQGYQLQMRRCATHISRNLRVAIAQIRILIARRH